MSAISRLADQPATPDTSRTFFRRHVPPALLDERSTEELREDRLQTYRGLRLELNRRLDAFATILAMQEAEAEVAARLNGGERTLMAFNGELGAVLHHLTSAMSVTVSCHDREP